MESTFLLIFFFSPFFSQYSSKSSSSDTADFVLPLNPSILFSCFPVLPTANTVLLFSLPQIMFSCSPVHPTADTVLLFSYSRVLLFSCSPYCRFCLSLIEKKHSLFTALIKFLFYPWFSLKTINVETRNGNCSELATILFFIIFIFTTPHNLTVGRMDIQTFTIYLLE